MDMLELMLQRHSVRGFTSQKIEGEVRAALEAEVAACNAESKLHLQLCCDEPTAFTGLMARYGKFTNVRNYFALVGPKGPDLEEKCGWFGQRLVLKAQALGLRSCWVAASYKKGRTAARVGPGEKLLMVIALGYGETDGETRKSKTAAEVSEAAGPAPEWFLRGVEAALLAPTAMNQQKFHFRLVGENRVEATAPRGIYTKTDLGIVKHDFAAAAGAENFVWAVPA